MSSAAISACVGETTRPQFMGSRHSSYFVVAGINVEVTSDFAGCADLGPQLAPFATACNARDIEAQVEWNPAIRPARGRELFHSGSLWTVQEFGNGFLFDFTTERLGDCPYKRLLVDEDFRQARVVLNRQCLSLEDGRRALEYPLDELVITHHLSLGRGVELHACGLVGANGESYLFAGHSGAGKSTTTRLWRRHLPVTVLSDDRIIVRKENGQFFMHGTPWHGEAAFASPLKAPVRRIFLLEHGSGNRMEQVPGSVAVGELLARSFTPFYHRRFVDPVLTLLEEMAESVPCYRFHFVPDQSAVERVLEFCH